jgi:hypothetical protein
MREKTRSFTHTSPAFFPLTTNGTSLPLFSSACTVVLRAKTHSLLNQSVSMTTLFSNSLRASFAHLLVADPVAHEILVSRVWFTSSIRNTFTVRGPSNLSLNTHRSRHESHLQEAVGAAWRCCASRHLPFSSELEKNNPKTLSIHPPMINHCTHR